MLAYLEDLCAALIAHDAGAIQRLLAHPLARSLPRPVREEAIAISRASPTSLRAPIQTLRFYHQTLQLDAPQHESRPDPGPDAGPDTRLDARPDARPDTQVGGSGTADHRDAAPDLVPTPESIPGALPAPLAAATPPALPATHPPAIPAEPPTRDPHRHSATPVSLPGARDQIEMPLDPAPRTAQAA
jgi:hypothetical protein